MFGLRSNLVRLKFVRSWILFLSRLYWSPIGHPCCRDFISPWTNLPLFLWELFCDTEGFTLKVALSSAILAQFLPTPSTTAWDGRLRVGVLEDWFGDLTPQRANLKCVLYYLDRMHWFRSITKVIFPSFMTFEPQLYQSCIVIFVYLSRNPQPHCYFGFTLVGRPFDTIAIPNIYPALTPCLSYSDKWNRSTVPEQFRPVAI